MNLRMLAESDLGMIQEDSTNGFGWPFVLVSPDGLASNLTGLTNDISLAVDPDTGLLISGRTASVSLRISTLRMAGYSENPKNVPEKNKKPWVVAFRDINGVPTLFKVVKSNPDRAIGNMTLILETYKQAIFYNGVWKFDGAQEYDGVIEPT